MNCKYYKIRTKTKNKQRRIYNYCTLLKKEITYNNCTNCPNKEYKCTKSLKSSAKIKGKTHKLTKATSIPMSVKKEVWERDKHCCIYCGVQVPLSCASSHYIKRSHLGLGIPQNIVCACPKCHDKYDFGVNILEMINYTEKYLKSKYKVWNKDMLVYKKS